MATQSEGGQNSQSTSTPIFESQSLRYMGLSGRGTVVYLTTRSTWRGSITQSVHIRGNKNLLRVDRKARISDVDARYNLDSLDMCDALPTFDKSSINALAHDERTLFYQSTQDTRCLWELRSVEEFQECYVCLLEAHSHAYDLGRVLHRGISESSALARIGDDGKVVGLLYDWDLGCFVNADGVGEGSTSQHRTGTTPFMAIDLQRQTGGKSAAADHRYCHDLESFFWLLLWAVVHFDLTNKCRLNCRYEDWSGSWKDSLRFKRDCLNNGDVLERVLDDALDMWKDVVKRWVKPLIRMLDSVRQGSMRYDDNDSKVFDDDAYAKGLTFEAFMHTIKETPREWAHEKEA